MDRPARLMMLEESDTELIENSVSQKERGGSIWVGNIVAFMPFHSVSWVYALLTSSGSGI